MTAPQQVWSIRKERARGGEKEESAILMMSFSPREEEEEAYAASRGTGAGLSMHMLAALCMTASVYPLSGLSMVSVTICPV